MTLDTRRTARKQDKGELARVQGNPDKLHVSVTPYILRLLGKSWDNSSAEVRESEKTLDMLDVPRVRPLRHGTDLPTVHPNSVSGQNEAVQKMSSYSLA